MLPKSAVFFIHRVKVNDLLSGITEYLLLTGDPRNTVFARAEYGVRKFTSSEDTWIKFSLSTAGDSQIVYKFEKPFLPRNFENFVCRYAFTRNDWPKLKKIFPFLLLYPFHFIHRENLHSPSYLILPLPVCLFSSRNLLQFFTLSLFFFSSSSSLLSSHHHTPSLAQHSLVSRSSIYILFLGWLLGILELKPCARIIFAHCFSFLFVYQWYLKIF